MSDDKAVTEMLPPVSVTVVGTGDGLVKGTKATTPPDQPNIVLNVVRPAVAIGVRFLHNYVTAIVTLLAAGMTTDAIPAADFVQMVMKCAGLAIGGPVLMLLKDMVTIFGKLEEKYPMWTGGV